MRKELTSQQISEINRHLTLALIGANHRAKQHIQKVLETLNGTKDIKNPK